MPIQTKLAVSRPGDVYEQEANHVAEQAMRMAKPEAAAEENSFLREAAPDSSRAASVASDNILSDLGPGAPLDAATRNFFEPRFGHDFSRVRVHNDARSAESAGEVNALAYTVGSDVVFGRGQSTAGDAGKKLLAHELTHVVQQGNSSTSSQATLFRKVGSVNCPPNVFGAPDDPRAALEPVDAIAVDLANQAADGLVADAEDVKSGIPDSPSVTFQSYQDHFGLPNAVGRGFLNRLTGIVRPSLEIAASEELHILSKRFRLVARLFSQGITYLCPGGAVFTVACGSGSCGTVKAMACRGHSFIILCQAFWEEIDSDEAKAAVLVHEAMHIIFGRTESSQQGEIGDATQRGPGRNFNIAGCYELIIEDLAGVEPPPPFPCPPVPVEGEGG